MSGWLAGERRLISSSSVWEEEGSGASNHCCAEVMVMGRGKGKQSFVSGLAC